MRENADWDRVPERPQITVSSGFTSHWLGVFLTFTWNSLFPMTIQRPSNDPLVIAILVVAERRPEMTTSSWMTLEDDRITRR